MRKGKALNAQCAETQAGERHVGAGTAQGGHVRASPRTLTGAICLPSGVAGNYFQCQLSLSSSL